jgi:hypothetical protein
MTVETLTPTSRADAGSPDRCNMRTPHVALLAALQRSGTNEDY